MSAPDLEIEAGTMLGRYRVDRLIAYGGMARVYEGTHVDLQKKVALKVMRPTPGDDRALLQRFILEARAASRLQHPHVIAIADVGVDRGIAYMVMDLLDGEDLASHLSAQRALSEEAITDLMLPVVSAIAAAHAEDIVHRDIKPENIFLAKTRSRRIRPVLLDFGISKRPGSEGRSLTRVGQALGTPHYMAPEQLLAGKIDARADQYALGVVLYQAVTGALPFEATSLEALVGAVTRGARSVVERNPRVDPEFSAVVARAMQPRPEDRYASVRDLGAALWPFASRRAQALWAEEFGPRDPSSSMFDDTLPDPPTSMPTASVPSPAAAVAPTESFESLQRSPAVTISVRSEDLRVFGSFSDVDAAALDRFLGATRALRFAKGSYIIRQGAHGHGCYLLVSGEVEVVKATGSHPWVIGRMRAGSVFGQIALVDHVPRTASVIAASEVVVVEIHRAEFDALLKATDEVAHRFREHIVVSGIRQLRRATNQLRSLTQVSDGASRARRKEFARVQVAAKEWDLPIEGADEPFSR